VNRSKRITLLLLLLLILIIICSWCHVDELIEKRAVITTEVQVETVAKTVEKSSVSTELKINENHINVSKDKRVETPIPSTQPIFYSIRKKNNQVTLEGTLNSLEQEKQLVTAINSTHLVKAININPQFIDKHKAIIVTGKILQLFNRGYREGFISYNNKEFTIGGVAKNETTKREMNQLLESYSIISNNYTKIEASEKDLKAEKEALIYQEELEKKAKSLVKKEAIAIALELEKEQETVDKAREVIKKKELRKKEAQLLEANIKELIDEEHIRFESSQSILTNQSKETIQKIAQILQEHPLFQIKISGYTDSSGDATRNLKLSQSRVNAVKESLIKLAIDANRIKAIGYGEKQPLVSNDTKENRRINRRVEFKIIGG
jgi:outer membrane protein OmpA-like peptidoglycan-associated protein